MAKKEYVRIQSSIDIRVTCGLEYKDVTNPDAHVADRLKINPLWPKAMVDIKQGAGIYPAEIVEWNTVKSLAADKVLTIGEFVDGPEDEKQQEVKEDLTRNIKEIKEIKGLAEIAGE